jgi:hypothetical protein
MQNVPSQMVFGNCGVLLEITPNKGYVEMTGVDADTSHDIAEVTPCFQHYFPHHCLIMFANRQSKPKAAGSWRRKSKAAKTRQRREV